MAEPATVCQQNSHISSACALRSHARIACINRTIACGSPDACVVMEQTEANLRSTVHRIRGKTFLDGNRYRTSLAGELRRRTDASERSTVPVRIASGRASLTCDQKLPGHAKALNSSNDKITIDARPTRFTRTSLEPTRCERMRIGHRKWPATARRGGASQTCRAKSPCTYELRDFGSEAPDRRVGVRRWRRARFRLFSARVRLRRQPFRPQALSQ